MADEIWTSSSLAEDAKVGNTLSNPFPNSASGFALVAALEKVLTVPSVITWALVLVESVCIRKVCTSSALCPELHGEGGILVLAALVRE